MNRIGRRVLMDEVASDVDQQLGLEHLRPGLDRDRVGVPFSDGVHRTERDRLRRRPPPSGCGRRFSRDVPVCVRPLDQVQARRGLPRRPSLIRHALTHDAGDEIGSSRELFEGFIEFVLNKVDLLGLKLALQFSGDGEQAFADDHAFAVHRLGKNLDARQFAPLLRQRHFSEASLGQRACVRERRSARHRAPRSRWS